MKTENTEQSIELHPSVIEEHLGLAASSPWSQVERTVRDSRGFLVCREIHDFDAQFIITARTAMPRLLEMAKRLDEIERGARTVNKLREPTNQPFVVACEEPRDPLVQDTRYSVSLKNERFLKTTKRLRDLECAAREVRQRREEFLASLGGYVCERPTELAKAEAALDRLLDAESSQLIKF